jgi:F-box and leucine-rich repeat protein 2/20
MLQDISSAGCDRITDVGISAVARGCSERQTIDLGGCRLIADVGVSARSKGCNQLQTVNLSGCNVTNEGVTVPTKDARILRMCFFITPTILTTILNSTAILPVGLSSFNLVTSSSLLLFKSLVELLSGRKYAFSTLWCP